MKGTENEERKSKDKEREMVFVVQQYFIMTVLSYKPTLLFLVFQWMKTKT